MIPLANQLTQPVFDHIVRQLCLLRERWQDERAHEDFADYQRFAARLLASYNVEFVSLSKRPFELRFNLPQTIGYIRVTARDVVWGQAHRQPEA